MPGIPKAVVRSLATRTSAMPSPAVWVLTSVTIGNSFWSVSAGQPTRAAAAGRIGSGSQSG